MSLRLWEPHRRAASNTSEKHWPCFRQAWFDDSSTRAPSVVTSRCLLLPSRRTRRCGTAATSGNYGAASTKRERHVHHPDLTFPTPEGPHTTRGLRLSAPPAGAVGAAAPLAEVEGPAEQETVVLRAR